MTSSSASIAARAAACAVALLLPACAVEGPFPSLAPREAESAISVEEPVRIAPVIAPDPALTARAAELLALARAGDRDFAAAFEAAAGAARASGEYGSESWVVAQQALSRLEAARAETMRALGALDQLALERTREPTAEADHAAILAALAGAEAIAARQQMRLDALRELVRTG